eukprot:Gregarina_sp_Pseudo_9__1937@NODE_2332_length_1036_cov_295_045135_g2148_i0_p1_GENE_NODE_2332_length_1036_cov_295_045135_g2148_i0NODE_2332_length_1036_cov_295_045135_g2148_i0_p1_ORF_typecomplete_len230_score17_95Pox_T4_N/PF04491_12/0_037_NODE_2332_length_1036_cov_295_045135_g2148_i0109798
MKFSRFCALIPVYAKAMVLRDWVGLEGNAPECAVCGGVLGTDPVPSVINECLTRVPASCQYTIQMVSLFQVTTVCTTTFGFSLEDITTTLASASILHLVGAVEMTLEDPTSTSCQLEVHFSDTEQCVTSPTGPGGLLTARNGVLGFDLSGIKEPKKYANFEVVGTDSACGTKFGRVKYVNNASALLLLKGSKVTGSSTQAPPSPRDNSGSYAHFTVPLAFLLGLLFTTY